MDEAQGIQVLRHRYSNRLRVGFTGTREGMTLDQWAHVENLFRKLIESRTVEWHDGDCIGADSQAHEVAARWKKVSELNVLMVGHPANTHERFHANNSFDAYKPRKPPLVRDKDIVIASDLMIAGPKGYEEEMRGSGTWATIRYARKTRTPLFIVWPDASVLVEIEEGIFDA